MQTSTCVVAVALFEQKTESAVATGRLNLCGYQLGDGGSTSTNAACCVGTVCVSLSCPPPWGPLWPSPPTPHCWMCGKLVEVQGRLCLGHSVELELPGVHLLGAVWLFSGLQCHKELPQHLQEVQQFLESCWQGVHVVVWRYQHHCEKRDTEWVCSQGAVLEMAVLG